MSKSSVRVRFAPSPTGLMHIGNVRTALMNYLFALQKNGTFVLRIEDTDPERNFDPQAKHILADLHWLSLAYAEGPDVGGPYAPYFQSKRMDIYKKTLDQLIEKQAAYRCFCTTQELEKKRKRQISLRMAPRYDRACMKLSEQEIQEKLDANMPFLWRMKLDHDKTVHIKDVAQKEKIFDLKNFSDFPLTRQNGTYTFMFANFVDDMMMKISHVLRGEDHATNTAGQAALYEAIGAPTPIFWHLPILCDINGKKLSKRDFGFSLKDLKAAGYLPEAICNYLAILGSSYEQEIMSLEQLTKTIDFDNAHTKGQIKFDSGKLNWINRKWIANYDTEKLTELALPFLLTELPEAEKLDKEKLITLVGMVQTDLIVLKGITSALHFYFAEPEISKPDLTSIIDQPTLKKVTKLVSEHLEKISEPEKFLITLKSEAKKTDIPLKALYSFLRLALMGSTKGPGIGELITMLGIEESKRRLVRAIEIAN